MDKRITARIRRSLATVALLAGLAYLAICGVLYSTQDSYLYFPTGRDARVPSSTMLRSEARVVVSADGIAASNHAVLYFGGNAEDVSRAIASLDRAFPGASVYAMHYRGYGGSTGSPSERALVGDAKALYDHVAKTHPRITIVGRSLGSGIAIQVAVSAHPERLVLVTPYASIVALGAARFPWLPVRWLMRDRYESWRYAGHLHVPTTLIVAGDDRVIPNASSGRLAGSFPPGVATVVTIPHAGHNDVSEFPGYLPALAGPAAPARR
jgi:pimeloyl-ACP methyl ester carboxylesterase